MCGSRLSSMDKHYKFIIQALIILLLVGPLQAQQVFQCDMMDAAFYDDCCCDDHNNCTDSDCDKVEDSNKIPCCDEAVELSINDKTADISKAIKSLEFRTGIDPPAQIILKQNNLLQLSDTFTFQTYPKILIHHAGSDTYLITQRLRI